MTSTRAAATEAAAKERGAAEEREPSDYDDMKVKTMHDMFGGGASGVVVGCSR